jgi:hypothetical protein
MTEIDMVPIFEEAGRAALPEPLIEASIVAGEGLYGVVTAGVGTKYVPHADVADEIVVEHAGDVYSVPSDATTLKPIETIDAPRPLFDVSWDQRSATKLDTDRDTAVARATLGASAQLLGLGARCVEMAAEYAKARHQFGKPIGSFQAVKHKLADALLHLEFARPVVYRAAWSMSNDDETKERDVSMAKAMAGDAANGAARAALQTLGAIGYTQEHDLHVWMKRIWALNATWGTPVDHRDVVARGLLHRVSR